MRLIHRLVVAAAAAALTAATSASPVQDAVERPAVMTQLASRSVLLGAAKAGDRLVAVGERGIVVLSDDVGRTWRQAQVPVAVTLTAVRFADAHNGFAIGHAGVVLVTSDGGETWHRRLDGNQAARIVLQEAQADGDAGALREAQRLVDDGADKPFFDLHVFDARRMLAVGAYNLAFYTDDGGTTWHSWGRRLPNPKALHWYALRVQGQTMLVAGEQGLFLLSDDGVATFRRITTPYHGSFFAAELSGPQDMLLAGLRGNVWRSANGGANWTKLVGASTASISATARRGDGQVLLATMGGELMTASLNESTDTLTAVRNGMSPLFALLPLDADQVLLLNGQGATVLKTKATK